MINKILLAISAVCTFTNVTNFLMFNNLNNFLFALLSLACSLYYMRDNKTGVFHE